MKKITFLLLFIISSFTYAGCPPGPFKCVPWGPSDPKIDPTPPPQPPPAPFLGRSIHSKAVQNNLEHSNKDQLANTVAKVTPNSTHPPFFEIQFKTGKNKKGLDNFLKNNINVKSFSEESLLSQEMASKTLPYSSLIKKDNLYIYPYIKPGISIIFYGKDVLK